MKRRIRSTSAETRTDSKRAQKIAATADYYINKYKKAMKVLAR